jgi:hypothetical protein
MYFDFKTITLFFSGKVIQQSQSNNREHMNSQPDSDPVSADQVSSKEFSDNAKSRLLMPPPCKICL